MNKPIVQGFGVLSLLLVSWGGQAGAQGLSPYGPYGPNTNRTPQGGYPATVAPSPMIPRAAAAGPVGMARPVQTVAARAYQEPSPSMPTPTPADTGAAGGGTTGGGAPGAR